MEPKVSVIISNRNDVSMLVVTIRSAIEELRFLKKGEKEIVVVDNSDSDIYEVLGSALPTGYCRDHLLKVYRQDYPCIFTARETAVEKASGKYIFCLDSHMLTGHDAIKDLYVFMERHDKDDSLGFAHAPISWAHQHERYAVHDRDMSVSELGNWGAAYKYERMITWKGMPWMCRREWFLDREKGLNAYGALADYKISWGGGDMHIGIKPWMLGFQNWAVPCNPCIHIGPFPKIDSHPTNKNVVRLSKDFQSYDKYRVYASSGNYPHAFGFLVSCYVLGGEPMMTRNKSALIRRFGRYLDVNVWWEKAIALGTNEKKWLDSKKIMSFEELLNKRPWDDSMRNSMAGTVSGAR